MRGEASVAIEQIRSRPGHDIEVPRLRWHPHRGHYVEIFGEMMPQWTFPYSGDVSFEGGGGAASIMGSSPTISCPRRVVICRRLRAIQSIPCSRTRCCFTQSVPPGIFRLRFLSQLGFLVAAKTDASRSDVAAANHKAHSGDGAGSIAATSPNVRSN